MRIALLAACFLAPACATTAPSPVEPTAPATVIAPAADTAADYEPPAPAPVAPPPVVEAPAGTAPAGFLHEASGALFPDEVAGFRRKEPHWFGNARDNVSCAYQHPDHPLVTVHAYVYPANMVSCSVQFQGGAEPSPETRAAIEAAALAQARREDGRRHFESAVKALEDRHPEASVLEEAEVHLECAGTNHGGWRRSYEFSPGTGKARAFTEVVVYPHVGSWNVKLRGTVMGESGPGAREAWAALVRDLRLIPSR